jgi:hypothetical protein
MKVKCIDNRDWESFLTINKTYNVVIDYDDDDYKIIDDEYEEWWYPKYLFKTIPEIRNDKINKLLK